MPWHPPRQDKAKSLALVAAIHAALAVALVSGLQGDAVRRVSDSPGIFDVLPPPPSPPPREPPPDKREDAAEKEAGAPDLQAKPAPVVLPPPPVRLTVPTPLPTADDSAPDTGSAPSAGAGEVAGVGRGAGGSGDGLGGGGSGGRGSGSGGGLGSEARLLSGNLTGRDYHRIRDFGSLRGRAVLAIEVSAEGRLTRCLPLTGSGNGALDAELCTLLGRTRWQPARDRGGRAVPVALRYVATWDRD